MITILDDKLIYTNPSGDTQEISEEHLPKFLGETVEFGEGLTFERLFTLVIINREIFNLVFHSVLGGYDINEWYPDFSEPGSESGDFKIVFGWSADYFEYQGKIDLTIHPTFIGRGKFDIDDDEIHNLAFSFTKLCDLKNKIVTIDHRLIIDELVEGEFKRHIDADYKPFKLFDILSSILYEISFHGSPESRDKFSESLHKQGEELEEAIKNGTINDITVPIDDVFKKFGTLSTKPEWRKTLNVGKIKTFVHSQSPKVLHILETGWSKPKMFCVIVEDGELGYPEMELLNIENILEKYNIDLT